MLFLILLSLVINIYVYYSILNSLRSHMFFTQRIATYISGPVIHLGCDTCQKVAWLLI